MLQVIFNPHAKSKMNDTFLKLFKFLIYIIFLYLSCIEEGFRPAIISLCKCLLRSSFMNIINCNFTQYIEDPSHGPIRRLIEMIIYSFYTIDLLLHVMKCKSLTSLYIFNFVAVLIQFLWRIISSKLTAS